MHFLFNLRALFYRFQAWLQLYIQLFLAMEMVVMSANMLFWGHWAQPLEDLALAHPQASHADAALVVALLFKLISVASGIRLWALRREWAAPRNP